MKTLFFLALLIPLLSPAQTASQCDPEAQEIRDATASKRLYALIKNKQFSAIEDELGNKLSRYERGEYSDLTLFWDITATVSGDLKRAIRCHGGRILQSKQRL